MQPSGAREAELARGAPSAPPVRTAVLFVSGAASDPGLRVGRLPLAARALIALRRAGIERAFVWGATLPPDPRFPPSVSPLPAARDRAVAALEAAGPDREQPLLCVHATVVWSSDALCRWLARVPAHTRVPLVARRPRGQDRSAPLLLAIATPSQLAILWDAFASGQSEDLRWLLAKGRAAPRPADGGFLGRVNGAADVATVERALLAALENPRDGYIDALFNRKLSRPISRLLLRLPVGPNPITVLSFTVALLGAAAFARGSYGWTIGGALMLQLAAVLDCCDGEVARIRFLESRFGDALDIALDAVANATVFLGVARGVWAAGHLPAAPALGLALAGGALGSFAVVTYAERCLPENPRAPEHRWAQRLVAALSTRDFSVVLLAAAVAGWLPWFLWGAAIGANIFWAVVLFLLLRGARLACQPW